MISIGQHNTCISIMWIRMVHLVLLARRIPHTHGSNHISYQRGRRYLINSKSLQLSPSRSCCFLSHHTPTAIIGTGTGTCEYNATPLQTRTRSIDAASFSNRNIEHYEHHNVPFQSFQRHHLSSLCALQNGDDEVIQHQSRLASIYDEMFENDNDEKGSNNNDSQNEINANLNVDVSDNNQNNNKNENNDISDSNAYSNVDDTKTNANMNAYMKNQFSNNDDDDSMLSSSNNDDYLDYILSSEVKNNNQNEQVQDADTNTNTNVNPNINSNGGDESMINDLFQDDYPASLPLSNQEIQETRNMVESNHHKHQSQRRYNTPKPIPPKRPQPKAASPPPLRRIEESEEVQQQSRNQQFESQSPQIESFKKPASSPPSKTKPQSQTPLPPTSPPSPIAKENVKATSESTTKSSPPPLKMTTTEKEVVQFTIHQIQSQIYKQNNNVKFNVNSFKQVSQALFGVDNESTNREVLEGLTGNLVPNDNGKDIAELAKLILEFRRLNSKLKKIERDEKNKSNGSHVNHRSVLVKEGEKNASKNHPSNGRNNFVPTEMTLGHHHHKEGKDPIEPLVIVDASAYIFRAYYSMPPIHRFDGEPTGATLGFCNLLNRLVLTSSFLQNEQKLPPRFILVFDSQEGVNFRKKMYPDYKANRKPCPIDLIPQFDFIRDAADAYGIIQLEAPGYEADDVIATIATKALKEGCFVNILSGDKDLMQLVTKDEEAEVKDDTLHSHNPCIQLIDPMNMVRFDYNGVIEKWGVPPEKLGDVLGLAGDTADNIPGVPGIGPKIAAGLIQEYGSLEGLLENIDNIKQKGRREKLQDNVEMARLSRKLVELERDVPMEAMSIPSHFETISEFRMEPFDSKRLIAFYERMGFRDLKQRVLNRIRSGSSQTNPSNSSKGGRYDSILDQGTRRVKSTSSTKAKANSYRVQSNKNGGHNGSQFSNQLKYKSPPEPSDFNDVPF